MPTFTFTIDAPTLKAALECITTGLYDPPAATSSLTEAAPVDVLEATVPDAKDMPPDDTPQIVYSIQNVRSALAALRKTQGTGACKALLEKHGVSSVSELPPEKYAAVIQEAEA